MTSFIRISDIPPEELQLLPISGLRQQIREDHSEDAGSEIDARTHHAEGSDAFHLDIEIRS
jgi:hypothetical protein